MKIIEMSDECMNEKNKNNKNNNILIALIIVAIVAFVAIVAVGVIKNRSADTAEAPVAEETSLYGDESLCIDADVDKALADYRMIEIFGVDNNHRSDVMFIAALNKKTNEAKLFTVYRDTLMKIDSTGEKHTWGGHKYLYYKCNRGYQIGGQYGTMKMMNSHLDLNIRECLGLDWDGVEYLVDAIGGITVDINDSVKDWMNNYYSGRDDAANYQPITHTGEQTLDGTQAVAYLRCRKDAGSDAGTRSRRNEDVLIQVFDKIKPMSTEAKIKLYDEVADYFKSNMSRTTITELIASLQDMKVTTCDGFPYDYKIMWDNYDAFYYWVPVKDLRTNVIKLHETVFGQKDYVPSKTLDSLNDELNEYVATSLH